MSTQTQPQPPEENSKMDALVKVVLVFFISLLSFSVGTFVGKQVSDSDHRRASLESDHGTRNVASADKSADVQDAHAEDAVEDLAAEFLDQGEASESDEDGYSSYERRDVASNDVASNEHSEEVAETPAAKPEAKPEVKSEVRKDSTHETAKKVSEGKAPTSGQMVEAPRKPTNTLPAASTSNLGKYTVQVASFGSEGEAKSHASNLKEKGWNAFYIPAEIKGKTWFRVSVGLFEEASNAQNFKKQFLKESGAKDALVVKIVQ